MLLNAELELLWLDCLVLIGHKEMICRRLEFTSFFHIKVALSFSSVLQPHAKLTAANSRLR